MGRFDNSLIIRNLPSCMTSPARTLLFNCETNAEAFLDPRNLFGGFQMDTAPVATCDVTRISCRERTKIDHGLEKSEQERAEN